MSVNIEIKSVVTDYEETKLRLQHLGIREESILHQKDVFYHVPFLRLTLRSIEDQVHELIDYFRHNSQTLKPSMYLIIHPKNARALNH